MKLRLIFGYNCAAIQPHGIKVIMKLRLIFGYNCAGANKVGEFSRTG